MSLLFVYSLGLGVPFVLTGFAVTRFMRFFMRYKKHIRTGEIAAGGERAPKGWVVPGLPTAYLIGRDGQVLLRKFGSKSVDKLALDVEEALARQLAGSCKSGGCDL